MEKLQGNELHHESWAEYADHSLTHDGQLDKKKVQQELDITREVPGTPLPIQQECQGPSTQQEVRRETP